MEMEWEYIPRLLAAVVAGSIIGLERELHDKPAGFRTNILICLGAALFTVLSLMVVGEAYSDRERIAAQVVSGVGFLGAGSIVHFKGNVLGLTTAATIWAVASIGMAFGAGEYLIGSVATAIAAGVLFGLAYAEYWIGAWRATARFKIQIEPSLKSSQAIREAAEAIGLRIRSWKITKVAEGMTVRISISGPAKLIERFQTELVIHEHVLAIRRV